MLTAHARAETDDWADLPAPRPALGEAAYRQERERALAFDPRRRANWERFQAARRGAAVDYLPVKADIENVSRCNYRCVMCVVSEWPKGRRTHDMSVETFRSVIDELYGLVEIKLQGLGEPLMQGDDLFEMIAYARSQAIWVRTASNASLLHLKDNYRKLIDSGVNEVQISVDGASKQSFEAIRRGAVFERVADNCRLINQYCRDHGIAAPTKMWTVVQKDNVHELEQLVALAAELGFASLVFSLDVNDWGDAAWSDRSRALSVRQAVSPARLRALARQAAGLGLEAGFWVIDDKYDSAAPDRLCPWPFERLYIGSDGRIVPCCMIANPDVYEIPRTGALSETWLGEGYQRFRERHRCGDLPEVCRGCYVPQGGG